MRRLDEGEPLLELQPLLPVGLGEAGQREGWVGLASWTPAHALAEGDQAAREADDPVRHVGRGSQSLLREIELAAGDLRDRQVADQAGQVRRVDLVVALGSGRLTRGDFAQVGADAGFDMHLLHVWSERDWTRVVCELRGRLPPRSLPPLRNLVPEVGARMIRNQQVRGSIPRSGSVIHLSAGGLHARRL